MSRSRQTKGIAMEPKNELVTIDGQVIQPIMHLWSPYTFTTYLMTPDIFKAGIGTLADLEDYDGYFLTIAREAQGLNGHQVWFKFEDGALLDQTRLASMTYKENRILQTAREHGITLEECRDRFFPLSGMLMKEIKACH